MKTVSQTASELHALRWKTQALYLLHTLLYVAALVLALCRLYWPATILGGANMLFYFAVLRRRVKGYSDGVAAARILYGLCDGLTDPGFTGKQGLTPDEFEALELLPFHNGKNSLLVRQAFTARGFGAELTGCEVTFHYPIETNGRRDYRFLNGTILTADRSKTGPGGDWLLIRRGMVDPGARERFLYRQDYFPAETVSETLKAGFDVFSHEKNAQMPAELERRLEQLFKKVESLGALRLTPHKAAVYLGNRFYTGRTKVYVKPEEKLLKANPLPERDAVWKLFRYWCA